MSELRPADPAGAGGDGPLGILAGGGTLPTEIAAHAVAAGREVLIVALQGEADGTVGAYRHVFVNWGQIGGMTAALRRHGCKQVVLAGTVRRPDLRSLRPDLGLFLALPNLLGMLHGGDDSVLRRVVRHFEHKGFEVVGVSQAAPELLAPEGIIGARELERAVEPAVARGLALLDTLGPFDVGQAVVATNSHIVAIEGAGGTDAMLEGLGDRARGGVLIKWPKPGQELRLDLPAVGPRTVALAARAGLAGIVVQAGGAVVLERERARRAADDAGIFLMGRRRDPVSSVMGPQTPTAAIGERFALRTRRAPSIDERADIAVARRLIAALAPHGAGHCAVVSRRYVLAVSADEPPEAAIERAGSLRQWGRKGRKPRGIAAIRLDGPPASTNWSVLDALPAALRKAYLAGLHLSGPAVPEVIAADLTSRFDETGAFLSTEEAVP